ncbi:MAG: metal-dependent hydrolase, partial [Vicinamibacteria bacterium]|nr:metal-dependent hydrolase [Vicinamibacteria bacterium]
MDNLTHTLAGVAIARMGLDKKVTGATLTLALGSNLPDLDIVSGFWGNVAYLEHHRGLSHAFSASPFLAGGLALVFSRWPRSNRRFVPTFLVAWLAVSLHIVFDLWTSYGTRALLPFDATWYSWDWIFIMDPALLLLLVVACFGARWFRFGGANRWAMAGTLAYVALRSGAHALAEGQAQAIVGPEFDVVRALPDPLSPNRWRLVARSAESFATGYVPVIGVSRSKVTFPRVKPDAVVSRAAHESRAARVFL